MSKEKDFENFIKNLQKKIESKEEKYYSKKVLKEYRNPSNFGFIKNPDASATLKGPCGDTMRIYLKIKQSKIYDARFWTDGCFSSVACGNILTKMLIGKTLQEGRKITDEDVFNALDGLPEGHMHCAILVINVLNVGIDDYNKKRKKL